VCYQYPIDVQRSLILDLNIYSIPEAHFGAFILLKKAIPILYGLISLHIVWQERKSMRFDDFIQPIQPVLYLALGFTIVRAIELLNHLTSAWLPLAYADTVGILGNYLTLCLVIGFMVLNSQRALLLQKKAADAKKIVVELDVSAESEPQKTDCENHELEKMADKINTHMRVNQPYLNSQLTLERFSNELSVSQRLVSRTVNQMFDCNFQEFINRYRIEVAKELLKSNDINKLTMEEIAHKAGFNSKPTFNRLFKNMTSATPSYYKQHYHELSAS
jgi:AraC-like DNA-binding protein